MLHLLPLNSSLGKYMHANLFPDVAILVDTSTGWGRRLIRGVTKYAYKHGPWNFWLEPHGQDEKLRLPNGWSGHGVIARIANQAMADHLSGRSEPVVNVSAIRIPHSPFLRVTTDTDALAEMALSHFRERGITTLGYVGLPNRSYSVERQKAFEHFCHEANCEFISYAPRLKLRPSAPWAAQQEALQKWLQDVPKPIGILSWGIRRGLDLANAARHCGLKVPDEVAILCGDDDELLCEATTPTLSGIIVASEQIGHEAANLLQRLMRGEAPPREPLLIKPNGIRNRASTDILAVDDPDVVAAIRFIHAHANRPIQVGDVAAAVAVSRRSLERRFQQALQCTMGEQIARVHLERAKQLLLDTDMPIPKIAEASGYGSPEYLATVFRQTVGVTPLKYRAQAGGRHP